MLIYFLISITLTAQGADKGLFCLLIYHCVRVQFVLNEEVLLNAITRVET